MIPKYDDIYLDFLEILSDEKNHAIREIRDKVAGKWGVSQKERLLRTRGGTRYVFDSRVGWARTRLIKAGLIESSSKGFLRISSTGSKVLHESTGTKIDNNFLKQFMEIDSINNGGSGESPEELMDQNYALIGKGLMEELLNEVVKMTPNAFEHLVVNLLLAMGYGGSMLENGLVTRQNGDEGIDGVIKEDKLGFDQIYIQAKKWDRNGSVSRPEIQKFAGALLGQGATKGLYITTTSFSNQAKEFAAKQLSTKIVLIDGEQLARLMIENNLGVTVTNTYIIRRLDSDYFSEL